MASKLISRVKEDRKLLAIARKLPEELTHLILYILDKKFRKYNSVFGVSRFYKEWIAPNLSYYVYWLARPIALILKQKKISFFVSNISHSPGQVSLEFDYFFKNLYVGKLEDSTRYV